MNLKSYVKGVNVIVDTLWGDSGKGKIVDMASPHVDMVVRYSGGANAGHTIKNDLGEFKLNLIPSGIFNSKVLNVIDSGVVLNPETVSRELLNLRKKESK